MRYSQLYSSCGRRRSGTICIQGWRSESELSASPPPRIGMYLFCGVLPRIPRKSTGWSGRYPPQTLSSAITPSRRSVCQSRRGLCLMACHRLRPLARVCLRHGALRARTISSVPPAKPSSSSLLQSVPSALVALDYVGTAAFAAYATQGSNPRRAGPRQVCYSHVCALPWTAPVAWWPARRGWTRSAAASSAR